MSVRIEIIHSDITRLQVDAIVNAANSSLLGGGGVDGAIHLIAGPSLLKECEKLGGCPTGQARITKGYNLPAGWVIHTVGPVWRGGNEEEDAYLARCYNSCFSIAEEYMVKTIAFPSISTGSYGFPIERASKIAMRETKKFLEKNNSIEKVYFVCFSKRDYNCYLKIL